MEKQELKVRYYSNSLDIPKLEISYGSTKVIAACDLYYLSRVLTGTITESGYGIFGESDPDTEKSCGLKMIKERLFIFLKKSFRF